MLICGQSIVANLETLERNSSVESASFFQKSAQSEWYRFCPPRKSKSNEKINSGESEVGQRQKEECNRPAAIGETASHVTEPRPRLLVTLQA